MKICVYKDDLGCKILTDGRCRAERCSFCQTEREKNQSEEMYNARMNSLPDIQQKVYADTYHGGKMPWGKKEEQIAC